MNPQVIVVANPFEYAVYQMLQQPIVFVIICSVVSMLIGYVFSSTILNSNVVRNQLRKRKIKTDTETISVIIGFIFAVCTFFLMM